MVVAVYSGYTVLMKLSWVLCLPFN